MKTKRNLFTILVLSALTACGGASEEQEAAAPEPTASVPAPAPAPTPTPPNNDDNTDTTGAADIAVPEGFNFSTNKVLPVLVSMNSTFPNKMYLTICHALPEQADNDIQPDLDNCLTRTPVVNGLYVGEVLLPNDVNTLAATLWSYEPAGVVKSATWSRPVNQIGELLITE